MSRARNGSPRPSRNRRRNDSPQSKNSRPPRRQRSASSPAAKPEPPRAKTFATYLTARANEVYCGWAVRIHLPSDVDSPAVGSVIEGIAVGREHIIGDVEVTTAARQGRCDAPNSNCAKHAFGIHLPPQPKPWW